MDPSNPLSPRQVGDRSRDAKHAMEPASRKAHRRSRIRKKLPPGIIRRCDAIEKFAVGLGIGPDAIAVVAPRLHLPGGRYTLRDLGTPLRRRRQGQVGSGYARHFDMQINTVEKWTR